MTVGKECDLDFSDLSEDVSRTVRKDGPFVDNETMYDIAQGFSTQSDAFVLDFLGRFIPIPQLPELEGMYTKRLKRLLQTLKRKYVLARKDKSSFGAYKAQKFVFQHSTGTVLTPENGHFTEKNTIWNFSCKDSTDPQ